MDPPPKKILTPKPHILDSNLVWYGWLWSVGPKDLKGRRTWDLEGRHRGFVGQHFFCINNISDFST